MAASFDLLVITTLAMDIRVGPTLCHNLLLCKYDSIQDEDLSVRSEMRDALVYSFPDTDGMLFPGSVYLRSKHTKR